MGNNASKPDGRTVIPPVAPVSPLSHSRREQKSGSATSRPSNPQQSLAPSQSQSQAQAQGQFNSHPQPYSQRHVPDDRTTSEISGQKHREKSSGSEQSTPVTVPDSRQQRQRGPDSQFEPSGPPRDPNYIQHSNLNFPPRLPLPIVEELHTPGSPIITSAGIESVLHDDDEILPRQNSGVSTTTLDDDELGDELRTYPLEDSRRTVPTLITWKQGGDKVYVTGTFTSWNKKFRMNRE